MIKILILTFLGLATIVGLWLLFIFFVRNGSQKVMKEGPIVFFGDSLTAGVGAGEGEDFPRLVAKELALTNVINAGVPGDTTGSSLDRLETDVLAHNPSIVVVELSGNDFLRGVNADETIDNLEEITKQIRKSGALIILVHIKFPRNADKYRQGFEKISKKYSTKVVWGILDGIAGNPNLMADTIHPNAAGYKIMAERLTKILKESL